MKTTKNNKSITAFLKSVADEQKRKDAETLLKLFKKATGMKPYMWGDSMIGFGEYEYTRRDGSKHKFFLTGFSPRVQNLTIYMMPGFKKNTDDLKKLGKHKTSVGCLYVKRLSDVDLNVLEKMVKNSTAEMKNNYI
ncbi:MAG: hypothetical protein COV34_02895 [Candidatus Zambryskibacteria bacterium CG10_big_fil_rev_8_21_14_0_10_42_12]|uniref:YdhG-like domain-containing protein n=1 Tax=Candidatus Zambryskibacteria bacterium CG10_big_fil_rev_8_21_14_0_10_42_12 TaxID=1975115 RepID=A0A2H0QUQ7_9BACT|nr:MAG: hypothetical protein COV34_02895 [Candidatus Zambryskibacteria bacterium CG10_big_fil_rev_8_21_14_0_10_42_12]